MARITQSPLPKLDSPIIQELGWREDSDHYRAYASILQVEMSVPSGGLVSVRVAGYLLIEFSTHSGIFGVDASAKLASWIMSPPQSPQSEPDKIIAIGTHLREKLIRMFRTTNTVYSQPSSHPSRPSFDTLEDMIKDSIERTSRDPGASKDKVLARDRFRCVITGVYHASSVQKCSELTGISNMLAMTLETAHIFNASSMVDIDPAVSDDNPGKVLNKTRTTASALATLKMFGFSRLADAFIEAGGVHQVWNLLMLEHNQHAYFDKLHLWFEYTDQPHRYEVCTLYAYEENAIRALFIGHDRRVVGAPRFVEFNTQLKEAPPPEPLLLALHAACARVAHMSGAAEFFDQIERDAEDIMVLSSDGSSAPLLSDLLSSHTNTSILIPGVA